MYEGKAWQGLLLDCITRHGPIGIGIGASTSRHFVVGTNRNYKLVRFCLLVVYYVVCTQYVMQAELPGTTREN